MDTEFDDLLGDVINPGEVGIEAVAGAVGDEGMTGYLADLAGIDFGPVMSQVVDGSTSLDTSRGCVGHDLPSLATSSIQVETPDPAVLDEDATEAEAFFSPRGSSIDEDPTSSVPLRPSGRTAAAALAATVLSSSFELSDAQLTVGIGPSILLVDASFLVALILTGIIAVLIAALVSGRGMSDEHASAARRSRNERRDISTQSSIGVEDHSIYPDIKSKFMANASTQTEHIMNYKRLVTRDEGTQNSVIMKSQGIQSQCTHTFVRGSARPRFRVLPGEAGYSGMD